MMWCYAVWCNDMMQNMMLMPKTRTHTPTQSLRPLKNDQCLFAVYFSASPLIFRCKFCIPLGTSFELLRLLFRRYKFCIPLGTSFELLRLLFRRYKFCILLGTSFELLRLIFQRYLALHSLWNDFWAENLHCAPLGATFCSFSKTYIASLRNDFFVASAKFTLRSLRNDFFCSFGKTYTMLP
jgi:hypothetical protein